MYQEIKRTAMAQSKRVVAHVTLDTDLNVLSYSPELRQWSCLKPNDLTRLGLFKLFPQLESSQELEMLAASAAIAIDNAQLIETLQEKMDDLTIQNAELAAFDHTVAHWLFRNSGVDKP